MAITQINVGAAPNDGTGDTLRDAAILINGLLAAFSLSKATPIDADSLLLVDSADTDTPKLTSLTNFKAFLKAYFDTLYSAAGASTAHNDTTGLQGGDLGEYYHLTADDYAKIVGDLSGVNTGDETAATLSTILGSLAAKTVLAGTDTFTIRDSEASGELKAVTTDALINYLASVYSTGVASWNGLTGIVSSDTDDLPEGVSNLYFTNGRALAAAPAETATSIGALVQGATDKSTPVDADILGVIDSAASWVLKKLSWSSLKTTLKTYFDTIYQGINTYGQIEEFAIPITGEDASVVTGVSLVTWYATRDIKVLAVKTSVNVASSSGLPTIDINDDGVSIFTTLPSIDINEYTSDTAATPAALSSTPLQINKGSKITIDVDIAGTGTKGLKAYFIFYAVGGH